MNKTEYNSNHCILGKYYSVLLSRKRELCRRLYYYTIICINCNRVTINDYLSAH